MRLLTRSRRRALLVACCSCLISVVLAQPSTPPNVDRPNAKVGDAWTYDRIDGKTKSKEFTTVITVTSADDKEIRTESKRTDNGTTLTTVRNRDLNRLVTDTPPGKTLSDPYHPEYAFPLTVGKTWEKKVVTTRSNQPDWKTVATLNGKVLGWEQVKVPAGTFNAIKIEIGGIYNGSDPRGQWNGLITETIWYVPELKNAARWTYQDNIRGRGDFNNEVWELVKYEPAP